MLHLPHQLWGAVWGPGRRGGLSPPISLQLRKTAPAAPETSPRAKVWRAGPGQRAPATGRTRSTYTHRRETQRAARGREAAPPRPAHLEGGDAWAAPSWRGTAQGRPPGPARPRPARPPAVTLGGGGGAAPGRPLRRRQLDARPALASRSQPLPRRC